MRIAPKLRIDYGCVLFVALCLTIVSYHFVIKIGAGERAYFAFLSFISIITLIYFGFAAYYKFFFTPAWLKQVYNRFNRIKERRASLNSESARIGFHEDIWQVYRMGLIYFISHRGSERDPLPRLIEYIKECITEIEEEDGCLAERTLGGRSLKKEIQDLEAICCY